MNVDNLEMEVANFKTDVSALNNKLDEKANNSDLENTNRAVRENTHFIMNYPVELESKADKTHTHKIADVEGLETALNSKASEEDMNSYADHLFNSVAEQNKLKEHMESYDRLISDALGQLIYKANESDVAKLEEKVDKKVSSDTIKNIAIIEKGASTTNIAPNTLIFEKE